jgi:hypothetical protein
MRIVASLRRGLFALAFLIAVLPATVAAAQDEPPGANAAGGPEMSANHHEGDHMGPIGPYLSAAELRNWPQGSRRPTPERLIRERSTAILAAAGAACDIAAASNPGETRRRKDIYELACADGPGFLIVNDAEPAILNCLHLAATEAAQRAADPDRPVTSICLLEGNTDVTKALQPLAAQVDPACVVDQGAWVGRVGEAEDRYEVGCAGRDGLWLHAGINQHAVTGSFTCMEVAMAGEACRFTDAAEHAAMVRGWLPATGAPACAAADRARLVGSAGGHRYYELSCGAEPGLILRTDGAGAFDQAWPCAQASGIAGGCKLAARAE